MRRFLPSPDGSGIRLNAPAETIPTNILADRTREVEARTTSNGDEQSPNTEDTTTSKEKTMNAATLDTWTGRLATAMAEIAPLVADDRACLDEDKDERSFTIHLTIPAVALESALATARIEQRKDLPNKKEAEPDPRPIERIVAGWWGAIERGEDRPATIEMERRIARALQRGGAERLNTAEVWRRVRIWAAARNRNNRRPPATILQQMIRDRATTDLWDRETSS